MQAQIEFGQSLSEKYRPRTIAGFVGLEKPKKALAAFCARPFVSSWFFLGPTGTGKTSMAQAIAKAIKAEVHHIPSGNCTVETIEEVIRMCHYVPLGGGWHVVIVDEADKMSPAGQLLFLSKTDATAAPPATIFIFTANDTRLLEPRFLSRCHLLTFDASSTAAGLPRYLGRISRAEGFLYPESLTEMLEQSGSNVRDALHRLEVELLTGDRRGIPAPAPVSTENRHSHNCEACGKAWAHNEGECALPWRSTCPACGGKPKTIYQARAEKAVATRTANIRRQFRRAR
ncbi:MAG TPA: AAA family ATPase [Chthoniobacterales bacterium]|nr:AAA family ATPase [Chthoniobacterales bacterium]